jgi:hypothetical protein
MLDLEVLEETGEWPAELAPDGEDFRAWWARHHHRLGHLHRRLVEQWVHRHWDTSPFRFIPLDTLSWRLGTWSAEKVLSSVVLLEAGVLDPEHDSECFAVAEGRHPTVTGFQNGSWDYPIVVLETPRGVRRCEGPEPCARFLLIEGRQRVRYLNVLTYEEVRTGPHLVFVLRSPVTEE